MDTLEDKGPIEPCTDNVQLAHMFIANYPAFPPYGGIIERTIVSIYIREKRHHT